MNKFSPFSSEIERLVNAGIAAIEKDDELKTILNIVYMKAELADIPPCCENARESYFNQIESYYQTQNPNFKRPYIMSNSNQFKLKKGVRQYVPSLQGHITEANCTDALALESLAENPGRINGFETFPADWQAQVAKLSEGKGKDKADAKKSDAPAK